MPNTLAPILYLPHGGGPLPLLGDPSMANLTEFLRDAAPALLGKPDAILMVSAHWEELHPTLTSAPNTGLLYDYYGFPPESYTIQYPAPGSPQLAQTVFDLLHESGFQPRLSPERNFDHGMFVPLKLIYPKADIPCVQLSLLKGLIPARHIALGKALAPLRQQNVLIIGSGMSFHNLHAFFSHTGSQTGAESIAFDHWLQAACCAPGLTAEEREQRLIEWEDAPFARYCHPREEHLMPLQVCFGAAVGKENSPVAEVVFNQPSMGHMVNALLWR